MEERKRRASEQEGKGTRTSLRRLEKERKVGKEVSRSFQAKAVRPKIGGKGKKKKARTFDWNSSREKREKRKGKVHKKRKPPSKFVLEKRKGRDWALSHVWPWGGEKREEKEGEYGLIHGPGPRTSPSRKEKKNRRRELPVR